MITTRCLKCGIVLNDIGQYCADCTPKDEPVSVVHSYGQTVPTCPTCGRVLESGGRFCGWCDNSPAAEVEYAGFWIRLGAYLIDGLVLGLFGLLVGLATEDVSQANMLQIVFGAIYMVGFWVADGATPGKKVFGLRVQMVNGDPIGIGAGVLRYIGYYISGLIFGIGFLMVAFTPEKRGLHDYIAGTVVVRQRKLTTAQRGGRASEA